MKNVRIYGHHFTLLRLCSVLCRGCPSFPTDMMRGWVASVVLWVFVLCSFLPPGQLEIGPIGKSVGDGFDPMVRRREAACVLVRERDTSYARNNRDVEGAASKRNKKKETTSESDKTPVDAWASEKRPNAARALARLAFR